MQTPPRTKRSLSEYTLSVRQIQTEPSFTPRRTPGNRAHPSEAGISSRSNGLVLSGKLTPLSERRLAAGGPQRTGKHGFLGHFPIRVSAASTWRGAPCQERKVCPRHRHGRSDKPIGKSGRTRIYILTRAPRFTEAQARPGSLPGQSSKVARRPQVSLSGACASGPSATCRGPQAASCCRWTPGACSGCPASLCAAAWAPGLQLGHGRAGGSRGFRAVL